SVAAAAAATAPVTASVPQSTPVPPKVAPSGAPGKSGSRRLHSFAIVVACLLLAAVAGAWVVHAQRTALQTADARLGLPPTIVENLATPPDPVRDPDPSPEVIVTIPKPAAAPAPHANKAAASVEDYTRVTRVVRTAAVVPPAKPVLPPPPVPVSHPQVIAPLPATLELALEHHFHEAQISIWVDDKLAFSATSRGAAHKRLFLHGSLEGKESHELQFPSGDHEIKVRVVAAGEQYDNSGIVHSKFSHDQRTV